jgi:hypothetical protein
VGPSLGSRVQPIVKTESTKYPTSLDVYQVQAHPLAKKRNSKRQENKFVNNDLEKE